MLEESFMVFDRHGMMAILCCVAGPGGLYRCLLLGLIYRLELVSGYGTVWMA